jgi:hypothetical protein
MSVRAMMCASSAVRSNALSSCAPRGKSPVRVQRCGIGSSCACTPGEKLAGVERDLQRLTARDGSPLPTENRAPMERAFGHDFSAVRIHADRDADVVASNLQAHALTSDHHILFRSGDYRPGTQTGDRLLAHELAHVVQQARGVQRAALDGGLGDPLEREAEVHADAAMSYVQPQQGAAEKAPSEESVDIAQEPDVALAAGPRDCDKEHILCFRQCWRRKPPWPIEKGKSGHYAYCASKCLAEYMACEAERALERAFESMGEALDWLARHPEVVVGTVVIVAGVAFVVATGGAGLILVAA